MKNKKDVVLAVPLKSEKKRMKNSQNVVGKKKLLTCLKIIGKTTPYIPQIRKNDEMP
jgi:hypothetical protein